MINNINSVRLGSIWNEGGGATYKDQIEAKPDFGSDLELKSPIQADLMMIRMKDGITTLLSDFSTSAEFTCSRCLDKFTYNIEIPSFENQFLECKPDRDFDPMELFLINTKDLTLDLSAPIRQEIILHFPLIPVCSERCKGLCASCGVNLNHQPHKKDCDFTAKQQEVAEASEVNKPFANLKDLLK